MEKGLGENAGGTGCQLTLLNNNVGSVHLLSGGAYTLIDCGIHELCDTDTVPRNPYMELIVYKLHESRGNRRR